MLEFFAGLAVGTIIGAVGTIFCLWAIGKAMDYGRQQAKEES